MTLRRAHDALEGFKQLDNHTELSPRQIAYLCIFALGEVLELKEVSIRFGSSYQAASNHVYTLRKTGHVRHARISGHQITKKGVNTIQKLFPHTYPIAL